MDLGAQQLAARVQVGDQVRVGLLHQAPGPRPDGVGEAPVGTHRVRRVQAVAARRGHVVLAEGRGDVDDPGAVVGRDELGVDHAVGAGQEGEGRVVLPPQELGARDEARGTSALAEHGLHQRLGEDQGLVAVLDRRVGDLGMDRRRLVGRQRPGRRRPHQKGPLAVHQREAHEGRRVVDVPVAEGDLVAGEGGAAPRAVRDHLVAAVQQAAVVELGEAPPDALDVAGVHRAVGPVGVDPEADPLGQALPLVEVGEHRLAAERVELGDAVGLDLGLARDPQPLLHLELHRQAVAVPAAPPVHETAAHGLEAREDVLEDARQDMVRARTPVGRGRPLVEDEGLTAGALLQAAREDVALAPEGEHALLHLPPGRRRGDVSPAGRHAASVESASSRSRTRSKSSNRVKGTPSADRSSASWARAKITSAIRAPQRSETPSPM